MNNPTSPGLVRRKTDNVSFERLALLYRVGLNLSAEKDKDRLLEMILYEAIKLCHADAGTLYLRNAQNELEFAMLHTESLGLSAGGTSGMKISLPAIPLFDENNKPNHANIASHAALEQKTINIEDAYDISSFDFSGTRAFDQRNGYRSISFLTVPLINSEDYVIGVLQLINAQDYEDTVIPFSLEVQPIVEALASQAAIALDNKILVDGQKKLLESFIRIIANAIDAKSPYTGGHCERVPVITEMLAQAACRETDGCFSDFDLRDEEWEELRIAAWLHDCGKITTPVHIMDKATKLEAISDRIDLIRARFEILRKQAEIDYLRAAKDDPKRDSDLRSIYLNELDILADEERFIEQANKGSEFFSPDSIRRLEEIAKRKLTMNGEEITLLDANEIHHLSVSRGTLTNEERLVINHHIVRTISALESLPFPRHLSRVPEYAGKHHERIDGTGYPRGIYGEDMSIPAKIMAIADIFEALTAQDRPYKKGKTLSEAMTIMGYMKADAHIDGPLFDLFIRSGVYREYAVRFLPDELCDDVDEKKLLAIIPKDVDLPAIEIRESRCQSFKKEYRKV